MTTDELGEYIAATMFTPGGTAAYEGPYYRDDDVTVYQGDCLNVLRLLAPDSVDAVVTDPPYGLEFMGKEWDAPWKGTKWRNDSEADRAWIEANSAPPGRKFREGLSSRLRQKPDSFIAGQPFQLWCQTWAAECLRVLKPGGFIAAFGGTRTFHRLACAIEDAGFEIRDSIGYGHLGGDAKQLPGLLAWIYGSG